MAVVAPFDLDGRTALVTGAGRGIGAATARVLDGAGARVALVARSEDELHEVAAGLTNKPLVLPTDLETADGPTAVARAALDAFDGRLDVLVNNAAAVLRKPSDELTVEEIDRVLHVNVRAVLLLCAAVLPAMVANGGGSIVNVSSVSGLRGTPRRAAYAASKAALDGITRALAMEYGPHGVRANSVAPGVVRTEMWREPLTRDGVEDDVVGQTALRRLATPEDIAAVVLFLASDASGFVTGEVLGADGGMRSTLNLYPPV
jgi:NAD(P)-dependent dehydrogenase (short-subunit alcohol dehydrogenase family)